MHGMQLLAVVMVVGVAVDWSTVVGPCAAAFVPIALPQAQCSAFGQRFWTTPPAVVVSEQQQQQQQQQQQRRRPQQSQQRPKTHLSAAAASKRQAPSDMGYTVRVSKPLGVVFGENRPPFLGLVVDDVEPGLNGGAAGMRVGDNLLTVNGRSVIGMDFDEALNVVKEAPSQNVQLQLYRGPVRTMYQVLEGRLGPLDQGDGDDAEQEEGDAGEDEVVVMDENYVSPVVIPVDQQDEDVSITPGQIFEALFGSPKALDDNDDKSSSAPAPTPKEPEKKKSGGGGGGGLFGMFGGGETIQLEGEDATGYKAFKLTEKEQQEAESVSQDPLSGLKTLGNMWSAKKKEEEEEDDTPPPKSPPKEKKKDDWLPNIFEGFNKKE